MADSTNTPVKPDDNLFGDHIETRPRQQLNIGINTTNAFFDDVTYRATNGTLDMGAFDKFLGTARNRDHLYALYDMMDQDSTIHAVLETYVEDATEPNENGNIIWATSDDPNIEKFVTFILKAFRADKNISSWVHCLCKYGDVYLKLLRKSEYEGEGLFGEEEEEIAKTQNLYEDYDFSDLDPDKDYLTEKVNMKVYSQDDPYTYHLEMMTNPAEMFELTKFDESYAFIRANVNTMNNGPQNVDDWRESPDFMRYKFKRSDVTIYQATEFAHGYLDDSTSRAAEEVQIFLSRGTMDDEDLDSLTYKVRRGQSLLHGSLKAWRELQLLEDSVVLNRVTKSSIVRAIGVEVGDMPKEQVQPHLEGIKSLMEQKSSLSPGSGYSSYTNPGPVENNIYIPTRGGVGALSVQQIGGDPDVGKLTDIEYFRDKLFGSLKVPKQYFGCTDDSTGFNGGTSLSIISARYAKTLVKIQNSMIQALTDAINLILASKGFRGYINKYTLRMTAPVTQNDLDRRENISSRIGQTRDIMDLISSAEDSSTKLTMLKSLLSSYINNPEVLSILQTEIDRLEEEEANGEIPQEGMGGEPGFGGGFGGDFGGEPSINDMDLGFNEVGGEEPGMGFEGEPAGGTAATNETGGAEEEEEEPLPTPEDLGLDFTQNENFE